MPRQRHRDVYVKKGERAAQGDFDLVEPLDYMLIDALPAEGTLLGGVIPLGETVRNMVATVFKGTAADKGMITGRLRAMEVQGLTKSVTLAKEGSAGWQATERGQKLVQAWKNGNAKEDEA